MKKLLKKSQGFVYYVSRRGVTGVRERLDEAVRSKVREIKKLTRLPVLVGFGVSSEDQIHQVNQAADGVIMGSALVTAIKNFGNRGALMEKTLRKWIVACHSHLKNSRQRPAASHV